MSIGIGSREPNTMLNADRLLAIAAHDLKNPVSGIMSAAEYLAEDAAALLEPEHLAVLASIETSSRQLLAIIDDLSEIASIESAGLHVHAPATEIVPLIRSAVEQNTPGAARKIIGIEVVEGSGTPPLEIDRIRTHQAIQRLLAIAVRAAPRESHIECRIENTGDAAAVSVRIGPPQNAQVQLPREAGAGISLALIQRIAEAHGGALEYGDAAGGGQMFRLTLPLPGRALSRRTGITAGREL